MKKLGPFLSSVEYDYALESNSALCRMSKAKVENDGFELSEKSTKVAVVNETEDCAPVKNGNSGHNRGIGSKTIPIIGILVVIIMISVFAKQAFVGAETPTTEEASIYLSVMCSTDGVNYFDSITARVGDTIHYKVVAKNLGNISTTRIAIKDQLPTGLVATTDAILKDTATEGATKTEALSSDFFTSTGAQAYQLSVGGAGWYIEYDAKITEDAFSGETIGAARLINTVFMDYAFADGGYGTLGNQASVLVLREDEP